jgi:hypothetical protein
MKRVFRPLVCLLICFFVTGATGCSHDLNARLEKYLKGYGLVVNSEPTARYRLTIPTDWTVQLGDYPIGLFWALANVLSRDVGLDLEAAKGQEVEVVIFSLVGGLPGPGDQSMYSYPSDAIILVADGKPVGAWLAFNKWPTGPSLRKQYVKDLTGLEPDEWLISEGYLVNPEKYADLAAMSPPDVIRAYFAAIAADDKARANACLAPQTLLDSLFVNRGENQLYNQGFGENNSYTNNIISAKLLSYRYLEPGNPTHVLEGFAGRTSVEVQIEAEMVWREEWANTPDHRDTRFVLMRNQGLGWKIGGFGTGP